MTHYFPHHQFQRRVCEFGFAPILNIGCAEDPANLAPDFGVVNMDMVKYQNPQNWRQGNALDTKEPDQHYGTVIIGEVLEHMTEAAAEQALREAKRILRPLGLIGITTPYDQRSFKEQCVPGHHFTNGEPTEVAQGCMEHHITVWTTDKLEPVLARVGLEIVHGSQLSYGVPGCEYGAGRMLMRTEDLQ